MTATDREAIFELDHYVEARRRRLENLFAHVDRRSLAGARVLELGCGTGEIGEAFEGLGCSVVSVDAVEAYVAALRRRFPHREAHVADLEHFQSGLFGRFDAIVCFGLLYHLARPAEFLGACCGTADRIFLETVVADAAQPVCRMVDEEGPDQSFSGSGCRPSPQWIRTALAGSGFEARDISSSRANWGGPCPSVFDWQPAGDGAWKRGDTLLRRMFVCERRHALR